MIYGARIRQARELREVLQQDLAKALGISGARLAQIERASRPATLGPAEQETLTSLLRLPTNFFEVPLSDPLSEGSMRFRAQSRLTKRTLSRALREAELTHELAHACAALVDAPEARVPSTGAGMSIEESARHTRAALSVPPDEPIEHVTHVLERGGVWIYLIETMVENKLDGFSTWTGDHLERPVVAIGEGHSWDRHRFTISHELAHLVMHRGAGDDTSGGKNIETEAHRFAGAFLMPEAAAHEELSPAMTLSQLVPIKMRWGMSVGALIMRATSLDIITAEHAGRLHRQLSARNWRTNEPGADARAVERPRAVRRMAELAFGLPVDVKKLSGQLGRYSADVTREISRYAPPPGHRRPVTPPAVNQAPSNVLTFPQRRRSRA